MIKTPIDNSANRTTSVANTLNQIQKHTNQIINKNHNSLLQNFP